MNRARPIFKDTAPSSPGTYWERRVVQWKVVVDDNGNLWKLDGEEIVDILDSGVDDIDDLSDDWQIMN